MRGGPATHLTTIDSEIHAHQEVFGEESSSTLGGKPWFGRGRGFDLWAYGADCVYDMSSRVHSSVYVRERYDKTGVSVTQSNGPAARNSGLAGHAALA